MAERRVQRRLAAILAADVVGYSRLMRADEAGTLAALTLLRRELLHPKVEEYGGRIVKTTGDGVLVEFGSAVDAVQHAVDVQQAIAHRNRSVPADRRLELRIGINIGDVIVEGDDLYGDGVNVAARLESLAEPGGICVSDIVHASVRHKLKLAFADLGEQSVKNIADPLRVYAIRPDAMDGDFPPAPSDALFRRPAVAVLPFDNLSGDPDQEHFADGLTEDIITALSLWRSFPVIARNSTFVQKGARRDIRKIGADLGARYVVEGSVRRAGDRLRVTAQLINAETGHHVWADRYDRDLKDLFAVQDEIATQVAATVAPELDKAEQVRLRSRNPSSLDAWEFYQRGISLFNQATKEANAAAHAMFMKAIELDPSYARAWAYLATVHHLDLFMEFAQDRDYTLARQIEAASKALALDGADSVAHVVSGLAALWTRNHDLAISRMCDAVRLNPSGTSENISSGAALDFAGRPQEGIAFFERALRLSPRANNMPNELFLTMLARTQLTAGRFDDALQSVSKALQARSDLFEARLIQASAPAHLGRQSEASAAFLEAKALRPHGLTLPASWARYKDAVANRNIMDGLRKAGWVS
jgi:adenylate cyclase